MARELDVYISGNHAGKLIQDRYGEVSFQYQEGYNGVDISVMMPKTSPDTVFQGNKVLAWFDNLLPDNEEVRKSMGLKHGIKPTTVPLLSHFGLDLPGAIQVVSEETYPKFRQRNSSRTMLTSDDIAEHLHEMLAAEESHQRDSNHAWARQDENWSLGGNQAKWALQCIDGKWYACEGSTPSNVIIKPGVFGMSGQALTECVSMRLAQNIGLPVADVRIEHFNDIDAIVVDRYDREKQGDTIVRIHQEDLCQAFGVFAESKYTNDGGPSTPQIVEFLKTRASQADVANFVDALLFNYAIAAPDAHAKNYSVLHTKDDEIKLAPLYDIASALPYYIPRENHKPHRLAMSIGGENRVGYLRKSSIEELSRITGIKSDVLEHRILDITEQVRSQMLPTLEEFSDAQHIDVLASRMLPRVEALCKQTNRSLGSGWNRRRFEIGNVRPQPHSISGNEVDPLDIISEKDQFLTRDERIALHKREQEKQRQESSPGSFNIPNERAFANTSIDDPSSKSKQQAISTAALLSSEGEGEVWVRPHTRGKTPVKGYYRKRPEQR